MKVASEYDKFYMIAGMRGSGVKDLVKYLMDQAVKRPWGEDPMLMDKEYLKSLSLEVVRRCWIVFIRKYHIQWISA